MKAVLLYLLLSSLTIAGPNVLSNTDHYAGRIESVIINIGTYAGSGSLVDQTCPTGGTGFTPGSTCGFTGSFVYPPSCFVSWALAAPGTIICGSTVEFYANSTTTPVTTDQPYTVLNESSGFYSIDVDQSEYSTLLTNGMVFTMPYCPQLLPDNDYPPVAMITGLPTGSPAWSSSNICGYDGGQEFSLVTGYLGGSDGTPSSVGATLAAIAAVMKQNHPTWNWQDIKGALRQTASNWSTGWVQNNAGALGYGNISYSAATAISSTSGIFLQAPGFEVVNHEYYATITLYPFVTARRAKEVVYAGGTWPAPSTLNEMTPAQITAAGGTKIFDNGGATGPQTFSYAPIASGSVTLTAITLDNSGNGSRVESFSKISQSFTIGTACGI